MLQPLRYLFAERNEGQQHHLEMLESEWYADDGQAAGDTEAQMEQGNLDASEDYPDDVHDHSQTAGVIRPGDYFMTERPERQPCHLEKLQSEWNTDDGQAEQQSHNSVIETDQNASEQQP